MIKTSIFLSMAAALAALTFAPAAALADTIIVVDQAQALRGCAAFQTAIGQIKTTYASQIAQKDTLEAQLSATLKPQYEALQTAQRNRSPNLRSLAEAFQSKQQAATAQLDGIIAPAARAQAYAESQIASHFDTAIKAVMTKRSATIVLEPLPQVVIAHTAAADATQDLIAQLNAEVPSVTTVVPAGWQPGQAPAGATPAPTAGGR